MPRSKSNATPSPESATPQAAPSETEKAPETPTADLGVPATPSPESATPEVVAVDTVALPEISGDLYDTVVNRPGRYPAVAFHEGTHYLQAGHLKALHEGQLPEGAIVLSAEQIVELYLAQQGGEEA